MSKGDFSYNLDTDLETLRRDGIVGLNLAFGRDWA